MLTNRTSLILMTTLFLNGCAEYIVAEAVVGVARVVAEQSSSSAKKLEDKKVSIANKKTGCILPSGKYDYLSASYCQKQGGTVTKNFLVECRKYNQQNSSYITQEWRCNNDNGYIVTAVSPNNVTGPVKVASTTKDPVDSSPYQTSPSSIVECALDQGGGITGYIKVTFRDCTDLGGEVIQ